MDALFLFSFVLMSALLNTVRGSSTSSYKTLNQTSLRHDIFRDFQQNINQTLKSVLPGDDLRKNQAVLCLKKQVWIVQCSHKKICCAKNYPTVVCEGMQPLSQLRSSRALKNCVYDDVFNFTRRSFISSCRLDFPPAGDLPCKDSSVCDSNEAFVQFVVEDMPFCEAFAILLWKVRNTTDWLTVSPIDLMPDQCRVSFYLVLAFDACLSAIISTCNFLLLFYLLKTKELREICGCFLVSLATADLLTGFLVVPTTAANFYLKYTTPITSLRQTRKLVVNLLGCLTAMLLCTPLTTLFGLSVFRYIALAQAFTYRRHKQKLLKIARVCILMSWILSSALAAFPIVAEEDQYKIHPMGMVLSVKMDHLYLYETILILGLALIWAINIVSCLQARKQLRQRIYGNYDNSSMNNKSNNNSCKRSKDNIRPGLALALEQRTQSVTRSFRALFITFTLCTLPLVIIQSFSQSESLWLSKNPQKFDPAKNNIWNSAMFIASRLVMLKAMTNAFSLYFVSEQSKFKNFVHATCSAKCVRISRTSCNLSWKMRNPEENKKVEAEGLEKIPTIKPPLSLSLITSRFSRCDDIITSSNFTSNTV